MQGLYEALVGCWMVDIVSRSHAPKFCCRREETIGAMEKGQLMAQTSHFSHLQQFLRLTGDQRTRWRLRIACVRD